MGLIEHAKQRQTGPSTVAWWKRAIKGSLINGCVWLMPPPIHFAALFMPFITGFSIAAERQRTSYWLCFAIGIIMALTLGGAVIAVGFLCLGLAALIVSSIPIFYSYLIIVVGMCIGGYTGIASFTGALFGTQNPIQQRTPYEPDPEPQPVPSLLEES